MLGNYMKTCLCILLSIIMTPLMGQDVPLIDAGNPMLGWRSNNGQEFPGAKVELVADPAVKKDGKPSLRLTADLTAGGRYCDMSRDVSKMKLDVESVSFWVKAPKMDRMTMRLIDGTKRCHQIRLNLQSKSDDWKLVTFPIARFFEKRGTAEAVQGVEKYETWGGKKGQDGFNGGLRSFILLTGVNGEKASMWVADLVVSVRSGTRSWLHGFETAKDLLPGWRKQGDVQIVSEAAFKGNNSLQLQRVQAQREQPCTVVSEHIPITQGMWQAQAALKVKMDSPDASYCGSLHFEVLNKSGKVINRVEVATPYGDLAWKIYGKKFRTSHQAVRGRFVAKINKTVGTFVIDDLQAIALDTRKRRPAVDRIVLNTPSLGNLLLPDAERTYGIKVETTRKLKSSEVELNWSVRDYWGAYIEQPATINLKATGKNKRRLVYEAQVDFSKLPLEIGRYYEFHATVPLTDNDPFNNSSGFAILPEAPSKAFKPIDIPFTSRNWDNRIKEYILLSDRLGFRIIGLWGRSRPTAPHKVSAPQIDLCAELNAGILTGCPANINAIEYYRDGWKEWAKEENIRGAIRAWFKEFGDHQPGPLCVNLGNEPHGTGKQVELQVKCYKIAYDEIKKIRPDTIVVATSVNANEEYFKLGYGEACDAFDFHVYETPQRVRDTIKKKQMLMEKYNCVKPIWATELGLNSQGLTRQRVSQDMVRKFTGFFSAGGACMNWFDLLYPDREGKALGTSGDSFNMFDSRYLAYAARLDAVMCYNLINGIVDKSFVAERVYDEGTYMALFTNKTGACYVPVWRDDGQIKDVFIELPGVQSVRAIEIDGRVTDMQLEGNGVMLTTGLDPIILLCDGMKKLPASIKAASVSVANAPMRMMRGKPSQMQVQGAESFDVQAHAPAQWNVSRETGNDFVFTCAEDSPAREGHIRFVVRNKAGATVGLLTRRPLMTGQLAIEVTGLAAPQGGQPLAQLLIANQSAQEQTVTWSLHIESEQSKHNGAYAAPVRTTAYLAESGNGSITVAAKSDTKITIPLANTAVDKKYQLKASITDSTGSVLEDSGELRP